MFIHPAKPIELKDVTYILLSMHGYDGYSIDSILADRHNLISNQIPVTPTLRTWLDNVVRQFIVQKLDEWSSILRVHDDVSDDELAEQMEQNFDSLFQKPDANVKVIEERATHQLRIEMREAVESFILDYLYRLSDQDRQDFFNQLTEDKVLMAYYEPNEERFSFSFSGQSYLGEDKDHFECGHVVVSPEDFKEIFG